MTFIAEPFVIVELEKTFAVVTQAPPPSRYMEVAAVVIELLIRSL